MKGFSLLEMMIAMGIMSIMALNSMKMMKMMTSMNKRIEQEFTLQEVVHNIQYEVSSLDGCFNTFKNSSMNTSSIIDKIVKRNGDILYSKGDVVDHKIKITDIKLTNIQNLGSQIKDADLEIYFENIGKSYGSKTKVKKIRMLFKGNHNLEYCINMRNNN